MYSTSPPPPLAFTLGASYKIVCDFPKHFSSAEWFCDWNTFHSIDPHLGTETGSWLNLLFKPHARCPKIPTTSMSYCFCSRSDCQQEKMYNGSRVSYLRPQNLSSEAGLACKPQCNVLQRGFSWHINFPSVKWGKCFPFSPKVMSREMLVSDPVISICFNDRFISRVNSSNLKNTELILILFHIWGPIWKSQ